MDENKALICEKLTELLKLTRLANDFDKIGYDPTRDVTVIYSKSEHLTGSYGIRCFNTAGDSGAQLIVDVIKELM